MFKLEIVMYNKDSKMKGGAFNAAFQSPSDRPAAREFYKSRPRIGLYPILHQSNDGLS